MFAAMNCSAIVLGAAFFSCLLIWNADYIHYSDTLYNKE